MGKIVEVLISVLHWTVFPSGYGKDTVRAIIVPLAVYEGLLWADVNREVNRWLESQGFPYHLDGNFNNGCQAAEIVESEEGFTAEKYTRLTGKPVPNQYNSALVAEGADGRVYAHAENGNMSINAGAPNFCRRGKLITKVARTVPDLVIIPEVIGRRN